MDILITTDELAQRLSDPRLRILDVRWTVKQPDGRAAFRDGHIPGAVFVDLDADLSDHSVTGRGRHPLPTAAALQASARTWGLNDGDAVVVYDDWSGQAAETAERQPDPGTITIDHLDGLPVVDADFLAQRTPGAVVFDARAAARYRGDEEPLDQKAGHIPGAVSAPTAENLTGAGTFRPSAELHARFAELGAETGTVAVYCGSGITATHQIAALAIAGYDAALYPGSWSEWSSTPGRAVATGSEPG